MKRIAKFEKVSVERFEKDFYSCGFEEDSQLVLSAYEDIRLPKRATRGSAGYDFFIPFAVKLEPGQTLRIPTGIRVCIDEGYVLKIYPRSGLGFKYKLYLDNTVGIIDSDYYYSDNEGHIQIKITNGSTEGKTLQLEKGSGFAQGIFIEYGITVDDEVEQVRNGGFGSTSGQ